jgi:hypothetical protein
VPFGHRHAGRPGASVRRNLKDRTGGHREIGVSYILTRTIAVEGIVGIPMKVREVNLITVASNLQRLAEGVRPG